MHSAHHYDDGGRIRGTGAVRHDHKLEDYAMHRIPGVAAWILTGVPDCTDLRGNVKQVYNQGPIPACVMYSLALMKSIEGALDRHAWFTYDPLAAYHEIGGDDKAGVPTRAALEYVQAKGMPVLNFGRRDRIGSYAFAPQEPAEFVATLKAALAAGQPCVIAARLPARFGWDSSGPATEAYHQMCLVGYNSGSTPLGNAIIGNSWGPDWGRAGFGQLSWEYLLSDDFHHKDVYAYTCVDFIDASLKPA